MARPVKVYTVGFQNINFATPVTGEVSPTGTYKLDENNGLLLVYDANALGCYGEANQPKVVNTYSSTPSVYYCAFINVTISGTLAVGSSINFKTQSHSYYFSDSGYQLSDNKIKTQNGYVYILLVRSGNSGGFYVSGFNLSVTQMNTYQFGVSSNLTGGYKSPSKAFTVELTPTYYADAISQYSIASGVFYFKASSASSYRSITFTGKTVTVPAGALASNTTYDVYLTAQSTNGQSATSSHVTISTIDGTAVVAPVSPNNEVTHGDITFSWNFSNTTGELQYAFDLQTSTNNSTWTTIFSHVVTSRITATYTQTHAGDTYWRVRGYNRNDVAGAWSESAHYVNNVPPQPPVILEVIAGGRIQVRWSAENQISYHIQVVQDATGQIVYDSGDVYGTESLALVNTYLPNGTYTIKVRISNIYGNESEWSTIQFQQSTELPSLEYTAEYVAQSNGVVITVNSEGFDKYYLVRNGELVAEFTETTYTDLFASGETNYRLIAVNSEDLFTQATFTINVIVPSARLIALDGTVFTVSERWNSLNNVEQSEEIRYSANEYLGATAPEHIFSKMRLKRFTRAFYDPNRTASQLLGTVAFYADEYGNGDWVAITSVSRSDAWIGDDTNLEMQVTTRNEAITYDV